MKISKKENISLIKIKKQKIKIILNIPKNNECFECSNLNPEFISLNNGIFLCKNCIKNHSSFPKSISNIYKNDLNKLTLKNIQFLCYGGNEKLKRFIQFEFPKLKKISYKNLYITYAMDYYRKNLEYLIEGGIKPIKPNKNKAYELIKINNNNNNIKKIIHNKKSDAIKKKEEIFKNMKKDSNFTKNNKVLPTTKSLRRYRPNLNIILPNFNNSLNNFNTINIYNYNDKIYTETYYKKRFFSQIFKHINLEENEENNNLTDINNITFNKEENNNILELENKKKQEKKSETNIKTIKKENFLNNKYINIQKNNIYEKPFFQNYVNTVNKGKRISFLQKGYELSSSDLKFFPNNIKDISQNTNKSSVNNSLIIKNFNSSHKIFKKKTVGSSFSIHFKNTDKTPINYSREKILFNKKEIFNLRNSDKNDLKNKLIEDFGMDDPFEEKGKIKVNRQKKINKKRKRYSLENAIIDNKYNFLKIQELTKNKNLKHKLDKTQKSKIIERIHRVTSNKKEKSVISSEKDKSENESQQIDTNEINIKNKEYTINKKDKSTLLIKDMINKPSNIKRNILEIIKSNNLSNLIISPNSKKLNHVFTEPKSIRKKDFLSELQMKELYQRKKDGK